MTDAELEGELAALRSRLTQLEDELSARVSQWNKIASQSKWMGIVFAAATIAFALAGAASSRPLIGQLAMPFLSAAIVLGLLAQLRTAPTGTSAKPSI